MDPSFYVPDGERFVSTRWTRGPWSPDAQHGGPPAALLGRAVERLEAVAGFAVARITVEILRSVPVTTLETTARVVRPGRSVQLAEASLRDADGDVALARAWLVRRTDQHGLRSSSEPAPTPGPADAPPVPDLDPWHGPSYFSAMRWRTARGDFMARGPAAIWMSMAVDLVAGETPSPLSRVLVAADSGNGISSELPWDTHLFVNTELTVHLFRPAATEWVCLDARTTIGADGAGLAESTIFDVDGRIGSARQALVVRPR